MEKIKIKYRHDIDGLRAIAVFAVILYHTRLNLFGDHLFKGGFFGVDIFLIISGYLITNLVITEINQTKKFSFFNFISRRIRRILPLLLFVVLISIPFAYYYLLPSSLVDFSKSILYSLSFISNYYFYFTQQVYEAEDNLLKPLLHTWSLSIEGQFYILFPFCLLLITKFFKKKILEILFLLFFISLFSAEYYSNSNTSLNFYSLFSRLFEFIIGSILFFLELNYKNKIPNFLNLFFSLIGILLILYSFFFLDLHKIKHPGIITLIPTIGAALVILSGQRITPITKILSMKIFVFFGFISYSLYLWHYPIFALYRYQFSIGDGSSNLKYIVFFLIIFISILSYFLIEKPFRNSKKILTKKLFFILTFVLLFISFVSTNFIQNKGFEKRTIYQNISIDREYYKSEIKNWLQNKNSKDSFNKKDINVLIVGNSHAMDMYLIFKTNKEYFKNYNFKISSFENLLSYLKNNSKNQDFNKNFSDIKNANIVLISNRFLNDEKSREELNYLNFIIPELQKLQKKIFLTTENISAPTKGIYGFTKFDYFINNFKKLPNAIELLEMEKEIYNKNINDQNLSNLNNLLKKISVKFNIKLLDKNLYRCDENKQICKILTPEGDKIFLDATHTTLKASKYFGEIIYKLNWFNIN